MSLTQQLLLRSLVARFWRTPYAAGASRSLGNASCTTASCCRTSSSRISPMFWPSSSAQASRLQSAWFAPHLEFRFPKYGDFATRGYRSRVAPGTRAVACDGRKGAGGTTVRYVDSSVERLQVKVAGLAPDRYVLTCNGRRVPLQPTGTAGEFVGGVRYRAWQPSVRAASDDRRARAAHFRSRRHLDAALDGRLPVPRDASGRPQLRDLSGERIRIREPPPRALLQDGPYARASIAPPRSRRTRTYPFTLDLQKAVNREVPQRKLWRPTPWTRSAMTSCSTQTARAHRTGGR